jgi:hypothetical protein
LRGTSFLGGELDENLVGSAGLVAQRSEKSQQNSRNRGFSQCLRRVAPCRNLSQGKPKLAPMQAKFCKKCIQNVSRTAPHFPSGEVSQRHVRANIRAVPRAHSNRPRTRSRQEPPSLPARASAARSAAGHPARKTDGLAPAVMNGTPSILGRRLPSVPAQVDFDPVPLV